LVQRRVDLEKAADAIEELATNLTLLSADEAAHENAQRHRQLLVTVWRTG
jgi:hypothetical protein